MWPGASSFVSFAKGGIGYTRYQAQTEGAGTFRSLNESLRVGRGFNPGIMARYEPGLQPLRYAFPRFSEASIFFGLPFPPETSSSLELPPNYALAAASFRK